MHTFGKHAMVIFLAVSLALVPMCASVLAQQTYSEEDRDAGAMAADLIFTRPLGLAAIVAGFAVYIVSIPFSAIGGNIDEAGQKLVADPVEYTFNRPLGEF